MVGKRAPETGVESRLRALGLKPLPGVPGAWIRDLAGGMVQVVVAQAGDKWCSAVCTDTWIQGFGAEEALKSAPKYDTLDEALHKMLMFDLTWIAAECAGMASDICSEDILPDAVKEDNRNKKKCLKESGDSRVPNRNG